MAKHEWNFTVSNRDTIAEDGKVIVQDKETGDVGVFKRHSDELLRSTPGFREADAVTFLSVHGYL
jgi:hypothetical protein